MPTAVMCWRRSPRAVSTSIRRGVWKAVYRPGFTQDGSTSKAGTPANAARSGARGSRTRTAKRPPRRTSSTRTSPARTHSRDPASATDACTCPSTSTPERGPDARVSPADPGHVEHGVIDPRVPFPRQPVQRRRRGRQPVEAGQAEPAVFGGEIGLTGGVPTGPGREQVVCFVGGAHVFASSGCVIDQRPLADSARSACAAWSLRVSLSDARAAASSASRFATSARTSGMTYRPKSMASS